MVVASGLLQRNSTIERSATEGEFELDFLIFALAPEQKTVLAVRILEKSIITAKSCELPSEIDERNGQDGISMDITRLMVPALGIVLFSGFASIAGADGPRKVVELKQLLAATATRIPLPKETQDSAEILG
jgi:hypothetical protein